MLTFRCDDRCKSKGGGGRGNNSEFIERGPPGQRVALKALFKSIRPGNAVISFFAGNGAPPEFPLAISDTYFKIGG